jgi:hypothetical protein
LTDAGWSSLVARRAHNPKVVGSNPAPATNSDFIRKSSIINHQSSIINHQSSIINHQSSIINHQSSIINHQSSIIIMLIIFSHSVWL